jgi:carboxypeptidase-like protein
MSLTEGIANKSKELSILHYPLLIIYVIFFINASYNKCIAMKENKYLIKVDNPCSQDWNSMTPNNAGRFCSHCSKTVIDFEKMTDAEILKVISKSSNELCGRFNTNQLNREIAPFESVTHSRFQKIIAGFLLGISSAKAQQPSIKGDTSIHTTMDYSLTTTRAVIGKMRYPSFIWGTVIDSARKIPVHGAVISIKNCKLDVITDSKGEFKFEIPDTMMKDRTIMTIRTVGYDDKDVIIDKKDLGKKQHFFIVYDPPIMMGAVAVVRRNSLWHKVKRTFF